MILLTLILSLAPARSFGQTCGNGTLQPVCEPTIPSDANIITTNTSTNGNGCYWVCSGITLTLTGSANAQIYLEENAGLSMLGGENYVWMKDNSWCTVQESSNTNWIRKSASSAVTDKGTNTVITTCPALSFDDTNAPGNGCGVVNSTLDDLQASAINIYPNPASTHIRFDPSTLNVLVHSIRIYSTSGLLMDELWLSGTDEIITLDINRYHPGLYVAILATQDGDLARRVMILH